MSWTDCELGDVVTLKRGHDLPNDRRIDGDIPVVSSSGITGWHNEARAEPPGVVTGRYGTIGEVFYLDRPYWPLNTALYAIDFHGNDPKFVAYFLRNQLKNYQSEKAAVPGVDRNVLHKIKVRCPDPQAQERIVSILSAYDDLIENNRRRIGLLEQAARLLYREWFVHLRFPGHETAKIVDGLPEGWEVSSIGEVVANYDRLRVPLSVMEREKRQGPFPYHGAAGVLDHVDGFIFDGRFLLLGEDGTVTTKDGTPMLQLVQGKFWVSNHAHVLQGARVSTEFLYCSLSSYQIAGHITGVAQPKITQKSMNRIPILLPTPEHQVTFDRMVTPLINQRFSLEGQNAQLTRARDLLLPRLMDGRIPV